MVEKNKTNPKVKKQVFHKSGKSMNNKNFMNIESIGNKRKLSSPQKAQKASHIAHSNKIISSKFEDQDELIYFRHSERRKDKVPYFPPSDSKAHDPRSKFQTLQSVNPYQMKPKDPSMPLANVRDRP